MLDAGGSSTGHIGTLHDRLQAHPYVGLGRWSMVNVVDRTRAWLPGRDRTAGLVTIATSPPFPMCSVCSTSPLHPRHPLSAPCSTPPGSEPALCLASPFAASDLPRGTARSPTRAHNGQSALHCPNAYCPAPCSRSRLSLSLIVYICPPLCFSDAPLFVHVGLDCRPPQRPRGSSRPRTWGLRWRDWPWCFLVCGRWIPVRRVPCIPPIPPPLCYPSPFSLRRPLVLRSSRHRHCTITPHPSARSRT